MTFSHWSLSRYLGNLKFPTLVLSLSADTLVNQILCISATHSPSHFSLCPSVDQIVGPKFSEVWMVIKENACSGFRTRLHRCEHKERTSEFFLSIQSTWFLEILQFINGRSYWNLSMNFVVSCSNIYGIICLFLFSNDCRKQREIHLQSTIY